MAASLALTAVALVAPLPILGILAVIALCLLGLGCIGWSERFLAEYTNDLRAAQAGTPTHGFVRAEMASAVGLDEDSDVRRAPSPHSRRRARGTPADEVSDRASDPGSRQL